MVDTHNYQLTDSQKLDKLLTGFDNLQAQYNEIKEDHDVLREECKLLREENKRLRQTLAAMSTNCGKDFQHVEQLLQEIEELKDTVTNGHVALEEYKQTLEERNSQLSTTVDALKREQTKRCTCLTCKFIAWWKK